jgi:aminoglycoside phosphotransferase (APT) family kinase protein
VIDVDRDELVIVAHGAPPEWTSWKELLLGGRIDVHVAGRLGTLLASWHSRTRGDEATLARFDDPEIFDQQRADPYYRTTMERRPELAGAMERLLDRLLRARECLVHGDYSPKNVLVGKGGMWVIDWEIAHAGDPSFDVAFMTNHLMLKAIHRSADRDRYADCARAFWSSYGTVADPAFVLGHVGCLMVARVDGKSPAEYLTGAEQAAALALGSSFVLDPPDTLDAALRRSGK